MSDYKAGDKLYRVVYIDHYSPTVQVGTVMEFPSQGLLLVYESTPGLSKKKGQERVEWTKVEDLNQEPSINGNGWYRDETEAIHTFLIDVKMEAERRLKKFANDLGFEEAI